ncbi:hypothetical protein H4S06_005981, partial [Coemansia sp. BCRC 34490]
PPQPGPSSESVDDEPSQCSTAVAADTQTTMASQLSGSESEDTVSAADPAALSQASTVFGSDLHLSSSSSSLLPKLGRPVRNATGTRRRLSRCSPPPLPPPPSHRGAAGLDNAGPGPNGNSQALPTQQQQQQQQQQQHRRGASASSSSSSSSSSATKRKYNPFDSLQHRDPEIPGWAAASVYKKGK